MPGRQPFAFDDLVGSFLGGLRSDHTRAAYGGDLRRFAAWCEAESVDPMRAGHDDVVRFRETAVADGASPATIARRLATLASFFSFAVGRGAMSISPVDDVARPGASAQAHDALDEADRDALAAAAARLDPKTVLLVDLLLLDGLKLGEVLGADAADLTDGAALTVTRRSGPATIDLHAATVAAADVYLRGRVTGPLLLGDARGRVPGRLTRFGADYLLKRAADEAGFDHPLSANTLRRTYVARAHAEGRSAEAIRDDLGQTDVRTVRRQLPEPS